MNITRNQMIIAAALILFLLFAPATCNGVTYWTGFRGCSTGNNEGQQKESGSNSMFFNLIQW